MLGDLRRGLRRPAGRPSRCARRRHGTARGLDRDQRAQMMLLTAFVLVIGFVALSGMVARVTQLPEETRQSVDRPIYTESEAVARGVKGMMERVYELSVPEDASDPRVPDDYPLQLEGLLQDGARHLERLESARGFRLQFVQDPTCVSGTTTYETRFALSDVQTRIEFTVTFVPDPDEGGIAPAPPADPADPPTPYTPCP